MVRSLGMLSVFTLWILLEGGVMLFKKSSPPGEKGSQVCIIPRDVESGMLRYVVFGFADMISDFRYQRNLPV